MTGVTETTPRISRTGVLVGLIAAGFGLGFSAPLVRPTDWPDSVDLLTSVIAWWCGTVLLVWLSLSLGMWTVALGRPGLENSFLLRVLTVPGSRRFAEGLLTVGMLTSCSPSSSQLTAPQIEVLGPADSTAWTEVDSGPTVSTTDLPPASSALTSIGSSSQVRETVEVDPMGPGGTSLGPITIPEPLRTEAAETPPDDRPVAATHVVVPGDNLWSIAERYLCAGLGRPASVAEIAPYWIEIIEANVSTISSGVPDLIYPGETIALPPIG